MRNRESNDMKIRAHGLKLKEMHMKSYSRHIVLALVHIVVGLYAYYLHKLKLTRNPGRRSVQAKTFTPFDLVHWQV